MESRVPEAERTTADEQAGPKARLDHSHYMIYASTAGSARLADSPGSATCAGFAPETASDQATSIPVSRTAVAPHSGHGDAHLAGSGFHPGPGETPVVKAIGARITVNSCPATSILDRLPGIQLSADMPRTDRAGQIVRQGRARLGVCLVESMQPGDVT